MLKYSLYVTLTASIFVASELTDQIKKCKKNERLVECPATTCQPQNCSQAGYPVACPRIINGKCPDKPACLCIDGYLRNSKGRCILKKNCPSCGGDPNARPGCGVNCGKRCSTYKQRDDAICPASCDLNGCDCTGNTVYDDITGKCVSPKQCSILCGMNEILSTCANGDCRRRNCAQLAEPILCIDPSKYESGCECQKGYLRAENNTYQIKECKRNEQLVECPAITCLPQNCSQAGYPVACPRIINGKCPDKPACLCIDGYLRNSKGRCIPKKNCPSCGGDSNARPGCGVNCGKRCSTYKQRDNAICPAVCDLNGCDCTGNTVYDDNTGKCVPPKKCSPQCGKYEILSTCANGSCDRRNCSQLAEPILCIDPIKCESGCVCQKEYLRADNGTCVPEKLCENQKCKQNEVYSTCIGCGLQHCSQAGRPQICDESSVCRAGCVCDSGYLRSCNGTCIPQNQCPSCGGDPNAIPGCGLNCGRLCTNYNKGPVPCLRICKVNACDCKEDYVYDEVLNICVLPQDCNPKCKQNEVYSTCIGCGIQHCSQAGKPQICDESSVCREGCVCDSGYLRACNGTCIPQNQCPSCGGDPNARPGCGLNCGRLCSNYYKGPVPCPRICKVDACDCKEDYVYDEVLNVCVLPQDCTEKPTSLEPTFDSASAVEEEQTGNLNFILKLLNLSSLV